jgi:phosphate transport system substrate-binding protein
MAENHLANDMKRTLLFLSCLLLTACFGDEEREQIRIVGSSTVYPFVTTAAERFGDISRYKTPIVESTGTGGGMKIFCSGVGLDVPADMTNASRQIKQSEIDLCEQNGVTAITEIPLGYDGIVLANHISADPIDLTIEQVFLALAKEVPQNGKLVANFYEQWSDIDPALPEKRIEVYGPSPTSGTRDAFVEIVMEKGCEAFPAYEQAYPDKKTRKKQCHVLREDGHFIEAGENDNIIIKKLVGNYDAFGIFGFSFLDANSATIQGAAINGVKPSFSNILSGEYPVVRSLFIYVKDQHVRLMPAIIPYLEELTAEHALGPEGYLSYRGLIPLQAEARAEVREKVERLGSLVKRSG